MARSAETLLGRAQAFVNDGVPLRAGDVDRMVAAIGEVYEDDSATFEAWSSTTDRRGRTRADAAHSRYRTDADNLAHLRHLHAIYVAAMFSAPKLDENARAFAEAVGEPVLRHDGGTIDGRGRIDADDTDPDDSSLDHRSTRGANAAVASANEMPDVSTLGLPELKTIAAALGAYSSVIRPRLADALLARFTELGAISVRDAFRAAWAAGGITAPSDDEAERSETSRARGDRGPSETDLMRAMQERSANAWHTPHADAAPSAPTASPSTADLPSEAELMVRQRSRLDAAPARRTRRTRPSGGGDQ